MDDGKRFSERPVFWPRLIGGMLLLVFGIAFRSEILIFSRVVLAVIKSFISETVVPLPRETPSVVLVLLANLIIFVLVYFIALSWVSLFVLPSHDVHEKQKVFERLVGYVFGLHGPAVFVKNGELITRKEEEENNKEGVKARFPSLAFVDLASAIVVEGESLPPILNVTKEPAPKPKKKQPALVRAVGPGIAFLLSGERIRGCVDLRKQNRAMKEIHGYTSDGIELGTNVSVTFTLGQLPDVMTVFDTRGQGLRVMNINQETKRISISDKIDEFDAAEIRRNTHRPGKTATQPHLALSSNHPPYAFEEEHIISAVLSQPRNTRDGKLEKWTELPAQVAASVLLDELSRVSYDQLYSLDSPEPDCYLYSSFKPEFIRKITEMGVLSYQFVQRKDGRVPQEGDIFNPNDYLFWEVTDLHNSRPLRDRGIKVIGAGFSDFKPIDNTIPEQRFDSWRARWQRKAELTNAEYDLEVMRKMNHARAQAQREIIYNLSQIFKLPGYTQDAMAIRVFQALESAAANPATNRLLPQATMDMLKTFQNLLFSQGPAGRSPGDFPPEGQGQG